MRKKDATPPTPSPDPCRLSDLLSRAGMSIAESLCAEDVTITALADDSRKVKPGSCFVAIRGIDSDGHRFCRQVVDAGAAVLVVEGDAETPLGANVLRVGDTRDALARMAAAFYGLRGAGARSPKLIGITGTNGKTTTAWFLRSILTAADHPTALLGTIEYDLLDRCEPAPLTTPGALDLCRHLATARNAGATHAVLEVSSHALDQRRAGGLRFDAGVFTNLSGDHADYHESASAYAASKRRLFAELDETAWAVVNADDPASATMIEGAKARVVRYGIDADRADVWAILTSADAQGTGLVLRAPSFERLVWCPLIGRHNAMNALAAAATAVALGIEADAIVAGIEAVRQVPGRLQRVEPEGVPFAVLVDYAHTDDALHHALVAVRSQTRGRVICVFGCGGDRDRTKRPRMAEAVSRVADIAFVTSDNPRGEDPQRIVADVLTGFDAASTCRVEVEADRRDAIEAALRMARPDDAVLIAGKGHETYQLVGDSVLDFDDAAVARAFFAPGSSSKVQP